MKNNKPVNNNPNKKANAPAPSVAPPVKTDVSSKPSFLSSFSFEDKLCLFLLALVIILVFVIRSNFSMIPFERDEGIYGYYGKLLLNGKIPYKDFYEQKFPGIFYFYAFMVGLFGETVNGLHAGFMYLNIVTVILIYFTARNLFTPIAGLISATTFAIVSITPFLSGFTVQSEHGVAFLIAVGLFFYSLFDKRQKWYYNFLMGVSFGCAIMVKTNGLFLILWGGLILIADFFFDGKRSFKELLGRIGIYSAGVLLFIVILFAIIFLKGSFKDMIYWTYYIPKHYIGKVTFEQGMQLFKYTRKSIIDNYEFFWIHSFLAVIVCLVPTISYKLKFLGLSLLFFSFMTIVPGLYFYGHYWIQALPGLAVAGGLTYYCIITIIEKGFKVNFKPLKYIYLTIFALFVFAHVDANKSYYFTPDYYAIMRGVYGDNPFPETMEIGNYINEHSRPEDGVVTIGSEPELYFYTQKLCPSRHAYFSAVVDNVPESKEWQKEFISDVEKAKPRYFVFYNVSISLLVQQDADQHVFTWMKQYIDSNYKLIGIADMRTDEPTVYKWNQDAQGYKPISKENVYVFEWKK
jgi:hypothetical protein